ncbi:MAG: hypothetical protein ACLVHV_07990 [Oscillospiraceae bacterium]
MPATGEVTTASSVAMVRTFSSCCAKYAPSAWEMKATGMVQAVMDI